MPIWQCKSFNRMNLDAVCNGYCDPSVHNQTQIMMMHLFEGRSVAAHLSQREHAGT